MADVRLTPAKQTAIRELAEQRFGAGTEVRLYGSRTDRNARGDPLTASSTTPAAPEFGCDTS